MKFYKTTSNKFSLQRMYTRRPVNSLFAWLALCLVCSTGLAQQKPSGLTGQTKEYFNRQNQHTALVIRLDGFETEFESRVFGPKSELITLSGVPSLRLGPVFQLIEAVDTPRELRLEITFGHGTSRADLDIHLIKLEPGGPDNSLLTKAYRMFSSGLQLTTSDNQQAWLSKVMNLKQAAHFFDQLGMLELQLWAEFYAHYFILTQLSDPITAAEGALAIQRMASRSRMPELELSALQLEGAATVEQMPPNDSPLAKSLSAHAQQLLQQAADMAESMDLQFEHARAIYHSGLAYEDFRQSEAAFERFDQAISIASAAGDGDMANRIRKHAAELHESLGNNVAAISLMQQISAGNTPPETNSEPEAPADEDNETAEPEQAEQEMAHYLFEQGRLLEKTYRHDEAIKTLREALALDQNSPSPDLTGPAGLLLGKALYGAGKTDEALSSLQEAIAKTPAYRHQEALEKAYDILATIHRYRGEFALMTATRKRHGMFVTQPRDLALDSYEQSLDALAKDGPETDEARSLLRRSVKQARESGAVTLEKLALLQLCALGERASPGAGSCDESTGLPLYKSLQTSGLPANAMQAGYLWAQILRRNGRKQRSMAALNDLIQDMALFHAQLPGVMGAWYWQNREAVFRSHMDQALEQAAATPAGADRQARALQALMTLDRLRSIEAGRANTSTARSASNTDPDRLRSLIAERQEAGSGTTSAQAVEQLDTRIARLVTQIRNDTALPKPAVDSRELQSKIKQLTNQEALLAHYLSGDTAYLWLARNNGVELNKFPWSQSKSEDLARDLEALRWDAAKNNTDNFIPTMDRLGRQLLTPVADKLPMRIYYFPVGRLEGLPVDALRWKGRYLAEEHHVVNILSLSALSQAGPRVEKDKIKHFFLAGNQLTGAGDFSSSQTPSREIRTVADFFIGPGLDIIQGAALQWDEFQDDRFVLADAIHLAVPCAVDLRAPAQTHFLMSDNFEQPGQAWLLPADIRQKRYKAALVVLSACDFAGTNESAFGLNTRLVEDFLQAEAGSVIASLWSVGDVQTAQFMQRFYSNLSVIPNISEALTETKESYLGDESSADVSKWAAFQLFLN